VYVNDVQGADTVVLIGDGGTERILTAGEATHPAIGPGGSVAWAEDLRRLRLRSPGGRVGTLAPPGDTRAVFSPIFLGPGRLAAVVEEAGPGAVHDAARENLYGVSRATGVWKRLTAFRAGTDRWTAIRSPVAGRDGTVWFVRVSGRASATLRPAFELWRLDPDGPARVRELPGEAYLAGAVDGSLLWNVYDREAGAWRLFLGGPNGADPLGCGAAMVDPRSVADPDLATSEPVPPDEESEAPPAPDGTLGIVVGDFETRAEAEAATGMIGPPAVAVGHGGSPAAVGPDLFAAAIPLEGEVDPVDALDLFRDRFPQYEDRSWIAVLGMPGEVPE
jgi:hypothetical protein